MDCPPERSNPCKNKYHRTTIRIKSQRIPSLSYLFVSIVGVWMSVCLFSVCEKALACMYMCGRQRWTSGIFLNFFPPYFHNPVSQSIRECCLTKLAGQQAKEIHLSQPYSALVTDVCCPSRLLYNVRDRKFGPPVCLFFFLFSANTLFT